MGKDHFHLLAFDVLTRPEISKNRNLEIALLFILLIVPAVLRVLQDRNKGLSSKPDLGSMFRFDTDQKSAQELQNCQCLFGFRNDFFAILYLDRLQNLLWFVISIA